MGECRRNFYKGKNKYHEARLFNEPDSTVLPQKKVRTSELRVHDESKIKTDSDYRLVIENIDVGAANQLIAHDSMHYPIYYLIKHRQMKYIKLSFTVLFGILINFTSSAQKPKDTEDWSKEPKVVTPEKYGQAPSDATVLYGGKQDAGKWQHENGDAIGWKASGALTAVAGTGDIQSKQAFGDVQLHIEWRTPKKVVGKGQGRGNSGVFLMGKYEVQVLDSYKNKTYCNGQAASIYKQHVPLVNACKEPGKWQTYDIFFTAPRFNEDESLKTPAYLTLVQNGILVQNHVELKGPTVYIGKPEYKFHAGKLPVKLQDHGNPTSFRNIWVRELQLP